MPEIPDALYFVLAIMAGLYLGFKLAKPTPQSPAPQIPASPKLDIDGTEPLALAKAQFFSSFGVPLRRLVDARVFRGVGSLDELPRSVAGAIRKMYSDGTAMGIDIAQLAHSRTPLAADQAVYFALAQHGNKPTDVVMYAFIDRNRA